MVKAPSINETVGIYGVYTHTIINDIVPTDSSVLSELVKNKSVLASVAVAQARIESANYTSDMAVNNKNLFGIKVHKCKYVTGKRNGHATFASFRDNIACYCEIQHRYLRKIDGSYAEDSLYCQKVKEMK
ncbi:MAG: glucosaminidase domain-containing protein [Bacteroidota bacterium]